MKQKKTECQFGCLNKFNIVCTSKINELAIAFVDLTSNHVLFKD